MRATQTTDVLGATLSRRQFVKAGGALVVGFGLIGPRDWDRRVARAVARNSLDPSKSASWCEIHADNTILIRTGRVDFGQSTITTAYRQIVAEELSVPFEAITTVVSGDTDRTPDGGPSVDLSAAARQTCARRPPTPSGAAGPGGDAPRRRQEPR